VKLLIISIVQSCNQNCYYCPTRRWLYPVDFKFPYNGSESLSDEEKEKTRVPVNRITNEALLKWLDKYIDPKEWFIELTGGEPGLYKEIGALIPALNERGYKGIIKTNGSLPIPKSDNFVRAAAWHEAAKEIPPYYDKILIIKNPRDDWRTKAEYCEKNNINYRLLYFNYNYENIDNDKKMPEPVNKTVFEGLSLILSMGQIIPCFPVPPSDENNIFNMTPPVIQDTVKICPKCVHCLSAESDIFNTGGGY
jgi:organic radical activating enzyme